MVSFDSQLATKEKKGLFSHRIGIASIHKVIFSEGGMSARVWFLDSLKFQPTVLLAGQANF